VAGKGNIENLTPFKKGKEKTGGKQKGYRSWNSIIKEITAQGFTTPEEIKEFYPDDKYTTQEIAVMAQSIASMKGDLNATKWLAETTDGKPKQTVDTTVTERYQLPVGLSKKELIEFAGLDAKQ